MSEHLFGDFFVECKDKEEAKRLFTDRISLSLLRDGMINHSADVAEVRKMQGSIRRRGFNGCLASISIMLDKDTDDKIRHAREENASCFDYTVANHSSDEEYKESESGNQSRFSYEAFSRIIPGWKGYIIDGALRRESLLEHLNDPNCKLHFPIRLRLLVFHWAKSDEEKQDYRRYVAWIPNEMLPFITIVFDRFGKLMNESTREVEPMRNRSEKNFWVQLEMVDAALEYIFRYDRTTHWGGNKEARMKVYTWALLRYHDG
jgi:hypothetical protein